MNPVDFLQQFVSTASPSGQEEAAAQLMVEQMSALGFEACIDEVGNAVGVLECSVPGQGRAREIALLGHLDTVPGDIPVRLSGGRLHGRGTVDAKGPLATFMYAAARCGPRPDVRLVVIGAVEEETATSRGARHVVDRYTPQACIIGEPSGGDGITLGYKGRLLLDYVLRQPMGHTAGPQTGVAEKAVQWWNALLREIDGYNRGRERVFDRLLPSLRQVNTASNGLTNTASMKVGVRLPPEFDADAFLSRARALAGPADLTAQGYAAAFRADRRNGLVRSLNVALRRHGLQPRYLIKTGTSDMNVVGPTWRCPIVAFGPGDSRLDHTPDEHIVIRQYLTAIDVLADALKML